MKAIEGYDYNIGAFSTYSIYSIRQAIERDIQNYGRTIRVPSYMLENINKIKVIKEELSQILEREPTLREISLKSQLSINEVKDILNTIDDPISLNTPMSTESDSMTLEGAIEDNSPTPAELVETKIFIEDFKEESKRVLTDLGYNVLIMYLGVGTREHTLKEIGEIYNHNREYIRVQKDNALNRLRRTRYIKELRDQVEENTTYYRSIDYSQPGGKGNLPSSSVENIVMRREKKLEKLKKDYELRKQFNISSIL